MGRQIKNFDKVTVRLLREELQKAVQSVMDFYGVEVERWQRNEDPRDANSVMSVFTPD